MKGNIKKELIGSVFLYFFTICTLRHSNLQDFYCLFNETHQTLTLLQEFRVLYGFHEVLQNLFS